MVKVVIDDAKGLVQSAGGGVEVNNNLALNGATTLQGASTVRGDQGYASVSGGTVVTLRCKRETLTMANGTTTTDSAAGFIPANSLVIACGLTIATPGAGGNHGVNITDWGLDGDADFFNVVNGGATIATDAAAGTAKIGCCDSNVSISDAQKAAAQFFLAADAVRLTHGNVGTQTTACQVNVDLWYYDLSATTGS